VGLSTSDVTIVGAGPYGLSAAAHLRATNGLDVRVFGDPMSFWAEEMPRGMLLRSPYVASHIADPDRALTLDAYAAANGNGITPPVPLDRFVDYGRWFQGQIAPDVDRRRIQRIESNGNAFRLTLADGETIKSRTVVVAAGIGDFSAIPPQFRGLPVDLASHSCGHTDFARFAGRQVVVIGGGQSALESAALLHEAGAEVEVLARAPRIFFLRRVPILHKLGPLSSLLFAPAEVGPAGLSRLVSAPSWYRRVPRRLQNRFAVRSLRPAGAAWLVDRLEDVTITTGRSVANAERAGSRVRLDLDDGSSRVVDHVLLATGYKVDIRRYPFLAEELLASITITDGLPRLSAGFESSVRGVYFIGAPSAWSFGPLMRFVAGTEFTAPVLAKSIRRRLKARA
jgi:cation diffusion facilitator CzcD-associated flavoprotein CzcO